MRTSPNAYVLPSSTHYQTEAREMYTEPIQKLRDTKRSVHLALQKGSKDAGIASMLGSDHQFFTTEYIKDGKRHVSILLSDEKKYLQRH